MHDTHRSNTAPLRKKTYGGETMRKLCPLSNFLTEYSEKNDENKYRPVAVGRYGIRTRESIYSKELAKDYSKNKLIYRNTLTVGMGSVQIDIGVLTDDTTYSVSPAYRTYKIAGIHAAYLRYCLECRNQDMFSRFAKRGSRQGKAIDLKRWLTYEIPVYDEIMQAEIVDRLDRVSRLIEKRQEQLLQMDELVKARFVELFGDPVLNTKGWECKTVIDECDCMVPGRDKPKTFTGDIPWITIEDLNVNGITYESKSGYGLTQDEIDEVNRKAIPKGSVIMSCVGNLGICSIAGKEMIINQQLHSFQCGKRLNNVFLMNYLGYRKDYMNKWASSTTVLYMNKSICNSIPIIIPPIELQNEFATFVEQTDKSKLAIQKSLNELETLKKALMQKYFGT